MSIYSTITHAIRSAFVSEHEPTHANREHTRPRLMDGDYRDDIRYSNGDGSSTRYHVTLSPTFRRVESLTESSSESYVFKYAELKLRAMYSNGDYRRGELPVLFIWDIAAPSGTLMPIARFEYINGEVERK